LHSGDIGTFCDEIHSTGASTGVIYCSTGFTSPALKKAKVNGIACCRLYRNEPPDIPEVIWLEHFTCKASVRLALNTDFTANELKTWDDVFDIEFEGEGRSTTVLDAIAEAFGSGEEETVSKAKERGSFPDDWQTVLTFDLDEIKGELQALIVGHWKVYRARMEAILLDGSYCLSDKSFQGSLTGPAIDVRGYHPGEAWMEMRDDESVPSSNKVIAILLQGDVKTALREGYGARPLRQGVEMACDNTVCGLISA